MTSTGIAVPADSTAYGNIQDKTEVVLAIASVEDTEAAVRSYFSDIPIMATIAYCESTFRHTLSDGSVLQGRVDSADTGVMQINKRYHNRRAIELGLNLEDLEDNMAYARYLYEKQGTQPWSASSPCWGHVAMR